MKAKPTMHPPRCRRRPAYYAGLQRQTNLAIAFRHAGTCRIYEDNDPLARVYRALNCLSLRYLLSAFPTHRRHAFLPLPQRERLLLCRFRAMLVEYAKHGFSLDRFKGAAPSEQKQHVQNLFVDVLAYPFEHSRPRWKGRDRKRLRVVDADSLPKVAEARAFFNGHPGEIAQLGGNSHPARRKVSQRTEKNSGNHTAASTKSATPNATL